MKTIRGYVIPVIFSDVYYLLRRVAKQEKVTTKLKSLLSIVDVLTMDRNVLAQALDS